jgi:predicted HTH transcriptional regulator
LIRTGPFDAAPCANATLAVLDTEAMTRFIREARGARGFPLSEAATPDELLIHLNLLHGDRPSHAAVLLFGLQPQRFLTTSEIKCAHFHGTEAAKPIPSYQVYKGTVFELVDQAVDFVMAKLNLSVGTRAAAPQAPVSYEIPREVVAVSRVNPLGRFATTKLAGEGPQVVAGDNLGAATRKLSHPATRSLIGTGFS